MKASRPRLTIETSPDRVGFFIHVTPRARRPRVGSNHGDALRVAVRAPPPAAGRANAACRKALADAFGVPASAVDLDPAAKGRRKRVRIHGNGADLTQRLLTLADSP